MRKRAAYLTCLLIVCPTVYAQYASDFEALNASPAGVVLTGQDGYYIPPGTSSVDYLAYTYAGNALGIPQNPCGGEQFVAGIGPAGGVFARAQRDINWGMGTTTWTHTYDVLVIQTEGNPGTNNIGSYSLQPFQDPSASYIHLFSWSATPEWQALYLGYDAAGVFGAVPGTTPGVEWEVLELNHWYRFSTDVHFGQNRVTNVSITDLETGVCTESELTDVYLEGGKNGRFPIPTGFRFFAGGGVAGNTVAWDNTEVRRGFGECVPCVECDPCDMNCDDLINAFDIEPFLELLFDETVDPCCGERGVPGSTGDTNGDGLINSFDIEGFLECLFP